MANQGILQAQLKVKNSMNLENGFVDNPLLKSVEGEINLTDENSFKGFASNTAIEHLDTVKSSSQNAIDLTNSLNNLSSLKYVRLEGNFDSSTEGKFSGNTAMQKLDLSQDITIKPNDLAENESLRELPKLDYSNPDLTDIITNDTNLKPTTFDISNEPNTNKLGIHGDSTHQLGNLEFVKVNPEAPFDNQITPQIDVSYTSLDRNGLVNLFNTMPYNVGYDVVGNPTIVDGVVSGFTINDFVITSLPFSDNGGDFELCVLFNKSSLTNRPIIGTNSSYSASLPFLALNNAKLRFKITNGVTLDSSYTLSASTNYKVTIQRTNTIYTLKLYSGVDVLDTQTLSSEALIGGGTSFVWTFGYDKSTFGDILDGSIDLNETYIKVNSQVSTGPVGYTVVGSPTIVDGVASGFSSGNYVRANVLQYIRGSDNFEIKTKFKTSNLSGNKDIMVSQSWTFGLRLSGQFLKLYLSSGSQWDIASGVQSTLSISQDTDYYLKFVFNGEQYKIMVSNDDVTYVDYISVTSSNTLGGANNLYFLNFGISASGDSNQFNGSIDLNETYIKINGKLWFGHESKQVIWFNGKPSQIKEVDISGATGTSSLTNDDKAIVTNKGWSLVTESI